MSKDFNYDRSPALAHKPITREEIEFVLHSGLKSLKDDKNSEHFIKRILATLSENKKKISELQIMNEQERLGNSLNDNPVTQVLNMIAELSDEQKTQVLDAGYLTEIAKLKSAQESADRARMAAISVNNRNRLDLGKILDDPDLPMHLRKALSDILKRD